MSARIDRFIANPPRRISEQAVTARRSKAARHYPGCWLDDLLRVQKGRCFWCRERMFVSDIEGERLCRPTIDHLVPLVSGGKNKRRNMVAACVRCNQEKGAMAPEAYLAIWQARHEVSRRMGGR